MKHVETWKRCPRCYNPDRKKNPGGGVGLVTHTRGTKRYLRCPLCLFTWSININLYKEVVEIEYKMPEKLSER